MLDGVFSVLFLIEGDGDGAFDDLYDADLINGFSFEHADALSVFGDTIADAINAAPTTLSSTSVVWGDSQNALSISGLNLSGISSLEELANDLEAGIAEGNFSSIEFISGGTTILEIEATGTAFSLISGAQRIDLVGQIPNSFQGMADLLGAVAELSLTDPADFSQADFNSLISVLDTFDLSSATVSNDGAQVAQLTLGSSSVAFNLAGLEFAAEGTFDFDSLGNFIEIISDATNRGQDPLDLGDIAEFGLTEVSVTGADGSELITITGNPETEDDLVFETLEVVGTDYEDHDVSLDAILSFDAEQITVDLGAGKDELSVRPDYAYYGNETDYLNPPDVFVDGGASLNGNFESNELDIISELYGIYTLNFEDGTFDATVDPDAIYGNYVYQDGQWVFVSPEDDFSEDNAVTVLEFDFVNFSDVDLNLYGGGQLMVTGDAEENRFDLKSLPDYFEIDGKDGDDRLKFDNGYYEVTVSELVNGVEVSSVEYLNNITAEDFLAVFDIEVTEGAWYEVFVESTGEVVGKFRNIESFQFLDDIGEDVFLGLEDLVNDNAFVGDDLGNFLVGDDAQNVLVGAGGNDVLRGKSESDILFGDDGDDYIFGDDLPVTYFADTAASVYRLYQATLGREPDANGHQNWTTRVATDELSLLQAANGFVNSTEFQNTYGALENADFVNLLYQNVLNRDADDTGLA
ncbi:DUF4214 domain-containing protein, partial [Octadecabacter sp. B2R22]|uniref:DUF4214 domain-containing protein n=1 Tax=Octadecabacter sp. B2R22 TaxID=2841570 RepID=UPI001C08AE45